MLLLLASDKSSNPDSIHHNTSPCLDEWNVFRNRGFHFIYLKTNSLLSKIEELGYIAKSTNDALTDSKSKLDDSVLELKD